MRKPYFCQCGNKGADELCAQISCTADQGLIRYTDSTIPPLHIPKRLQDSSFFLGGKGQFVSDLDGNPEDLFSHIVAHF